MKATKTYVSNGEWGFTGILLPKGYEIEKAEELFNDSPKYTFRIDPETRRIWIRYNGNNA